MAGYSAAGLNAALAGVISEGTKLSMHTGDPGTTGASEAAGVARLAANWAAPTAGSVDSSEVPFVISGAMELTHFGVWTSDDTTFITGGELDESETFSANGGTYNFTATLTAETKAGTP